jgi:hypothetical protein
MVNGYPACRQLPIVIGDNARSAPITIVHFSFSLQWFLLSLSWGADDFMGLERQLVVTEWAALFPVTGVDAPSVLGRAVDDDAIPSPLRRRMGRLERYSIRCALGLLDDHVDAELIFCSQYGNLETLTGLLRTLSRRELVSPMAFSGSVHNATPGLIGQMLKRRLNHTAISAGANTLTAGLIEAYARLVVDLGVQVILIYCDLDFPEILAEFDEESGSGIALALRLSLGEADADHAGRSLPSSSPRQAAIALLGAVRSGERHISAEWSGCAS